MREILFKGRCVGEDDIYGWVDGYYVRLKDSYKNRESHRIYTGYAECDCGNFYGDWYEVDPRTVREFTGLYTVNGNAIFEGDIVKFDGKKYVVKREDETHGGSWSCTAFILDEVGVSGGISFEDTIDDYYNEICVEIIGNIYDNPELIS